ncbi:MAG: hypothetical protein ACFNX9_08465 [Eikenella corrodens]|uniref:hypothetical protein n=1 Tax=Eikenella corrodens TaxID=539 RepID=UPI003617CE41
MSAISASSASDAVQTHVAHEPLEAFKFRAQNAGAHQIIAKPQPSARNHAPRLLLLHQIGRAAQQPGQQHDLQQHAEHAKKYEAQPGSQQSPQAV